MKDNKKQAKLAKFDNIPFLASNFAQAKALWDASREEIQKSMAENGLQLLYAVAEFSS